MPQTAEQLAQLIQELSEKKGKKDPLVLIDNETGKVFISFDEDLQRSVEKGIQAIAIMNSVPRPPTK